MTWDQVCGDFEAISLNWDPALCPDTAIRHWYVIWQVSKAEEQVMAQEARQRRFTRSRTR